MLTAAELTMLSLDEFIGSAPRRAADRRIVEGRVIKPRKWTAEDAVRRKAWKKANPDKVRAAHERYKRSAKGAVVRKRARKKRYWSDPEKARARAMEYYYANRDREREKSRAYYLKNREVLLEKKRARNASGRRGHFASSG